jgi:membrane protease YdiL (CAAX protease family)
VSTIGLVVKRHSLLIYFALVFVISWGGGFLVLGPEGLPLRAEEFETLGIPLYVAILAGPCVAGISMTWIANGEPGLRELVTRLRRWRVGWSHYLLALLPALLMTATTLALSFVASDFRPALLDSNDKVGILMSALGPALLVGSLEEIGWTGFAVPQIRAGRSILVTGLAVGVVWGAWHLPLFWQVDSFSATVPLVILLTRLFSWLPPLRVLLVWMNDRTHSLPVVMLMHAAVSFASITLSPETLSGPRLLISLLLSAATMWLLLTAVSVANRGQLSRPPLG